VVVGGFIVQGSTASRVIIRAIGPELTQHGVPDALHNPTLELHDGTGALIASNDNWVMTIIGGIITQNQVRDIMNSGHAPSNGLESAIIADLPPGNYTAIVRGGSAYQPQGSIWYFPQAYRNDQHSKLLLMSPGRDRSGSIGFRCVADAQ